MYPMYNTYFGRNQILNQVEAFVKPCVICKGRDYTTRRSTRNKVNIILPRLSNPHLQSISPLLATTHMLRHCLYSSSTCKDVAALSSSGSEVSDIGGFDRHDLFHKVKKVQVSSVIVASKMGEKVKEVLGEATHHVEQLLDIHPYLRDGILPIGVTIMGMIVGLAILPRILKRFHKYSSERPSSKLPVVSYEKSVWGALEVPVRWLIIFIAFSQICVKVAPTRIASQYIAPASRRAAILSFVWFLHRWQMSVIIQALNEVAEKFELDVVLTVDKSINGFLFVIGGIVLAKTYGWPLQRLWDALGIGGVLTAFASKEIFENILSGLSVKFSRRFSTGDTIKAGSVKGKVIHMGLTSTSIISAKQIPIKVPNSLFTNQVIINESHARCRPMVSKILIQIDELEKIPQISKEIKKMMKSNSKVFLGTEQPYCYMSRVEKTFAELSFGCNLNDMSKEMLYLAKQDVLMQSVRIIKNHGATLASS